MAAAATLLLHAALMAAAVIGLSSNKEPSTPPTPLTVQIVPVQPPAPAAPPAATPPSPAPTVPEKARPKTRPRTEAQPKSITRPQEAAPIQAPDASFEARPSPSNTFAAPAAPQAAMPAPTTPARTAASNDGYATSNPEPPYPRLSRNNNEEGTVVLRILVKADGTAGAVEIKTSSGYPLLDNSARSTVQKKWRFKPATINGKAVDEWYEQRIPFTLTDD